MSGTSKFQIFRWVFIHFLFLGIFTHLKDWILKSFHQIWMNEVSKWRRISYWQSYAYVLLNLFSKTCFYGLGKKLKPEIFLKIEIFNFLKNEN